MEAYINASDGNIVSEGIKDPILKTKLLNLTQTYLSGLYKELGLNNSGEVMTIKFSGVLATEPRNESCCICMVECSRKTDSVVVPDCGCLHKYYHEECLRRWFRVKKVCPTCNKRCNGKGYRKFVWENPYASHKQNHKGWQCCGGTHRKKSTFKSLASALKHANTLHGVNIRRNKIDGVEVWMCNVGDCVGHILRTNEEALRHLQSHHRIEVITER